MKKLKKHIPAFLYAFLILTIASLSIYILNPVQNSAGGITDDKNNTQVNPDDVENTSGETKKPEPSDVNKPDAPTIPTEPDVPTTPDIPTEIPKKYDGIVPRKSTSDELYAYSQRIYGNKLVSLCDVLQTSVGVYAIVRSESTEGDICGKTACLGIVKLDAYGNVLSAFSVSDEHVSVYVDACPTAEGITVVAKNDDNSDFFIYVISYELSDVIRRYKIGGAADGAILPTSNSFLFFAEYPEETLVYTIKNNVVSFQSVGRGRVNKIFEYGSFYALITSDSTNNSYSCTQITKSTLSVLSETRCDGALCIDVFPVYSPDGQNFIVLEQRNGAVYAKKFSDVTFTKLISAKRIGVFDVRGAYFDGENVLVVCKGNVNGVIALSPDLNAKINELNSEINVNSILDGVYRNGTLYYLVGDENGKLALVYNDKDLLSVKYFDVTTTNAKILVNLDGSFMLFYQNNDEIFIVGL